MTIFLVGVIAGSVLTTILIWLADSYAWRRRSLPPATRKQIDRAARASRADLRTALPFRNVPSADAQFDDGPTEDFEPPSAA